MKGTKVRLLGTPYETEVVPYFENGMFAGFTDTAGKLQPGMIVYKLSDLEFLEAPPSREPSVDWSAFRREAAKDILAGMLAGPRNFHEPNGTQLSQFGDFVNVAVFLTDALIAKLKEDKQ